jgi:hypothetical protein
VRLRTATPSGWGLTSRPRATVLGRAVQERTHHGEHLSAIGKSKGGLGG